MVDIVLRSSRVAPSAIAVTSSRRALGLTCWVCMWALLGVIVAIIGVLTMEPQTEFESLMVAKVIATAGFPALVGVLFDIMPASKAAWWGPIEVLRYE